LDRIIRYLTFQKATRRRAGKEKLLASLDEMRTGNVILFVEPEDLMLYQETYRNLRVLNIFESGAGLSFVRQYILDFAKDYGLSNYWMLDDDIKGWYRREGNRTKKGKELAIGMLEDAERMFRQEKVWHGGLEYQSIRLVGYEALIFNSFCDNVVWVDVAKCVIYILG
jgi:hypothetical protein